MRFLVAITLLFFVAYAYGASVETTSSVHHHNRLRRLLKMKQASLIEVQAPKPVGVLLNGDQDARQKKNLKFIKERLAKEGKDKYKVKQFGSLSRMFKSSEELLFLNQHSEFGPFGLSKFNTPAEDVKFARYALHDAKKGKSRIIYMGMCAGVEGQTKKTWLNGHLMNRVIMYKPCKSDSPVKIIHAQATTPHKSGDLSSDESVILTQMGNWMEHYLMNSDPMISVEQVNLKVTDPVSRYQLLCSTPNLDAHGNTLLADEIIRLTVAKDFDGPIFKVFNVDNKLKAEMEKLIKAHDPNTKDGLKTLQTETDKLLAKEVAAIKP